MRQSPTVASYICFAIRVPSDVINPNCRLLANPLPHHSAGALCLSDLISPFYTPCVRFCGMVMFCSYRSVLAIDGGSQLPSECIVQLWWYFCCSGTHTHGSPVSMTCQHFYRCTIASLGGPKNQMNFPSTKIAPAQNALPSM